ncbi:hypothetical protein HY024_02620 [Candidatus Curtissbacteria bacterium]|nr:hypothetical protein [Candidatus Curtissbacteria bacterium]
MGERAFNWLPKSRVGRTIAAGLAATTLAFASQACDGDDGGQKTVTPITPGAATQDLATAPPSTVRPPETMTIVPSLIPSPTPRAESSSTPTPAKAEVTNGVLVLDGFRDAVEYDGARYRFKTPITIEARINLNNSFVGGDAIIAKGDKTEAIAFFARLTSCPDRGMAVHIGSRPESVCGPAIQTKVSVDVAMTFSGTEVVFYQNGKEVGRRQWDASIPVEDGPLFLGKSPNSLVPFAAQENFGGTIDYVRVLSGASTPSQLNRPFEQVDRQRVLFDAEFNGTTRDPFAGVDGKLQGGAHLDTAR